VAYDEELAERIRGLIGNDPDVSEKAMFGGLAFLVAGNMAVGSSAKGGLMVRVDRAQTDALLEEPHAEPFVMRGRAARGWLRVAAEGLLTDEQLEPWLDRGVAYARSLPPKR
jgi:TfoX/Sxy family transcriptional regulator of competence genes